MSREVKRVPMGFSWPIGETWWGFLLDSVPCELCDGSGKAPTKQINGYQVDGKWSTYESEFCPCCEGEGKVIPKIEIPEGPAYQMWETTSEGSPISPTFMTPEELARWLADNGASAFGDMTATYEQWLSVCKGGWAPSAVIEGGVLKSGVQAMGDLKEKP